MFVADFNKGRIYNFNQSPQRTTQALTGVLSDRAANTDSETQSVIFGEGFGGIADLKVGLGDGYLYVLSIGNGAVYRILPNALSTASFGSADDMGKQRVVEEDHSQPTIITQEELGIPLGNDDYDNSHNLNEDGQWKKLANRTEQVKEQEDRGSLTEDQARQLRERLDSMQNNLGCK